MNTRWLLLTVLTAGQIHAQETPAAQPASDQPVFRVLEQSVVRKPDGGTVTFKRVEPPVLPLRPAAVAQPLTPEVAALLQALENKTQAVLSISATVQPNGLTVLRWSSNGNVRLEALSNVDFRLLAGQGHVATADHYYSLVMAVGADTDSLTQEQAMLAKSLPADGRPSFVLLHGKTVVTAEEQQAVAAMEVLHDYFETNRAALIQLHAQRETERTARELAARNAPPGPKHTVIHFWPLQPTQRAAIQNAKHENPEPAKAGTTQHQHEGGAK